MSSPATADHNLIAHEPGKRLLGVAARSGKVIELRAVADDSGGTARLERLENGAVTNPLVFIGEPKQVAAILDAMKDVYWIEAPAAAAPAAPIQAAAAAAAPAPATAVAAAPPPARSGNAGAIAALAASIVLVGGGGIGYLAYRDHAMTQAAIVQAAAPQQVAAAPAPVQIAPTQASPGAKRAVTAAPAVTLPGGTTTVAKVAEKAPETAAPRASKPADAVPAPARAAQAERPVKPLPEIAGSEPDAAAAKTIDDGRAVAAAVLGASDAPRSAPIPKPSDAPAVAAAPATPAPADTGMPNAFVERSKAAVAEGASAAVDARKEIEAVGAEKAQANLEVMQQVYEALNRSDKISPEMALQLPHDLAQKLREAGAILTPEEAALSAKVKGEQGYKIIRLSPDAYDRLKDSDGMPTVPASNSWAATGGNVRLPLPGGGDIKGADDLRNEFHLEP